MPNHTLATTHRSPAAVSCGAQSDYLNHTVRGALAGTLVARNPKVARTLTAR
jgi:hypothetical protein